MQIFLGILLLVMSIFLVIAVLMQNGKSKRLSGSIAGGAETFFGKSKSRTIDAVLSKVTTVVAILFILVVIIVYVAFGTEQALTLQDLIDQGLIQVTESGNELVVASDNELEIEENVDATDAEGATDAADVTETPDATDAEGTTNEQ